MAGVEIGDFGSPDETRTPDKTTVEIVRMGGVAASRMRLEPGWKWSECIKPVAKTDSCQVAHVGHCVSGRIRIRLNDGSETKFSCDGRTGPSPKQLSHDVPLSEKLLNFRSSPD